MNSQELLDRISKIQESDRELCKRKNHDYSTHEDALWNLRDFGCYGVVVRLTDKFARLRNFFRDRKEPYLVSDETFRDTLRDIRVYAALAEIMLDEEESQLERLGYGKKIQKGETL